MRSQRQRGRSGGAVRTRDGRSPCMEEGGRAQVAAVPAPVPVRWCTVRHGDEHDGTEGGLSGTDGSVGLDGGSDSDALEERRHHRHCCPTGRPFRTGTLLWVKAPQAAKATSLEHLGTIGFQACTPRRRHDRDSCDDDRQDLLRLRKAWFRLRSLVQLSPPLNTGEREPAGRSPFK